MTFDELVDVLAQQPDEAAGAIACLQEDWDAIVPQCRALLHGYVHRTDLSERTEQALAAIILLLGEQEDTAAFPDLCLLAADAELCGSLLGEEGTGVIMPSVLISTFDGDRTGLQRLVEDATADPFMRGDALLVLAYLARTGQFPERELYDYLAALPDRLEPQEQDYVWFGWVRAVAALGFAGLSSQAEQIFKRGLIDPTLTGPAYFWAGLGESLDDPGGMTSQAWDGIGPVGTALEWLESLVAEADEPRQPPEPVRNPLRLVGRNDPCPCGSGRKYKKCCLPG